MRRPLRYLLSKPPSEQRRQCGIPQITGTGQEKKLDVHQASQHTVIVKWRVTNTKARVVHHEITVRTDVPHRLRLYTKGQSKKETARMRQGMVCAPKERQGVRSIRTPVARWASHRCASRHREQRWPITTACSMREVTSPLPQHHGHALLSMHSTKLPRGCQEPTCSSASKASLGVGYMIGRVPKGPMRCR